MVSNTFWTLNLKNLLVFLLDNTVYQGMRYRGVQGSMAPSKLFSSAAVNLSFLLVFQNIRCCIQ